MIIHTSSILSLWYNLTDVIKHNICNLRDIQLFTGFDFKHFDESIFIYITSISSLVGPSSSVYVLNHGGDLSLLQQVPSQLDIMFSEIGLNG